jgi:hypothetical protein
MIYGDMGQIPPSKWKREMLVKKVEELQEKVDRLEGNLRTISSTGDRIREEKQIRIHGKKKKGVVDAVGMKHVASMTRHTILSNLISNAIWVPSALAAGEFSVYMLLAAVTTSVLAPLQKYIQKRQEVY